MDTTDINIDHEKNNKSILKRIITVTLAVMIVILIFSVTLKLVNRMEETDRDEYITMAQLYSQITWTPISASEYIVEFENYDPGDTVKIKDIITNILVGSHMITIFGYRSLGNNDYLTWPLVEGNLSDEFEEGDPVIIELRIIEDRDPWNGKEGEWFETVREDSIRRDSVRKAEWNISDIPVNNAFKHHEIIYVFSWHIDFENMTLIEFKIFHNETPFFTFGLFQGGGQSCSELYHHGIDDFSTGLKNVRIIVTNEGDFMAENEISLNIKENESTQIHIDIYEDHIELEE